MNLFGVPPEALTGAGVTTLGLSLAMLALFISGRIASGKLVDRLFKANDDLQLGVKEMADALDRRNEIDAAVISDRAAANRPRGRA